MSQNRRVTFPTCLFQDFTYQKPSRGLDHASRHFELLGDKGHQGSDPQPLVTLAFDGTSAGTAACDGVVLFKLRVSHIISCPLCLEQHVTNILQHVKIQIFFASQVYFYIFFKQTSYQAVGK